MLGFVEKLPPRPPNLGVPPLHLELGSYLCQFVSFLYILLFLLPVCNAPSLVYSGLPLKHARRISLALERVIFRLTEDNDA